MRKLHADEVATDASLARRLVAAQFPHTHPPIVRDARRTIDEVLADPESAWYGPGPGKT